MNNKLKYRGLELFWATVGISAGALIVYLGNEVLGVSMNIFYGVSTFNGIWAINLFLVPFIAGIAVSFVYGLGGKILSYFAPLPIWFYDYLMLNSSLLPDGVYVLPIYYWLLLVIVASEFSGLGGIVGETLIKRTYGRRPKHLIHKRYQLSAKDRIQGKATGSAADL